MIGLNALRRSSSKCKQEFDDRLNFISNYLLQPSEDFSSFLNENSLFEEKWDDIVTEELSDEMQHQQSALWELITFERNYLIQLIITVKMFLASFRRLKDCNELSDIKEDDIFANISDILRCHEYTWTNTIYPSMTKNRKSKKRLVPNNFLPSSKILQKTFIYYTKLFHKVEDCINYVHTKSKQESPLDSELTQKIKRWIKWTENMPQSNGMKLAQLLRNAQEYFDNYTSLIENIIKKTFEQDEIIALQSTLNECITFTSQIKDQIYTKLKNDEMKMYIEQFEKFSQLTEDEDDHVCSVIEFLRSPIKTLNSNGPTLRFILNKSAMKLITRKTKDEIILFIFSDVICLSKFNKVTKKHQIFSRLYFLDKLHFMISQHARNIILLFYFDEVGLLADAFSLELQPEKVEEWIYILTRSKRNYENILAGKVTSTNIFKDEHIPKDLSKSKEYKKVDNFVTNVGTVVGRISPLQSEAFSHKCIESFTMSDQLIFSPSQLPSYDSIALPDKYSTSSTQTLANL